MSLYPHEPSLRMGPTPRRRRHPDLEIEQILKWADAHHARTGEWPTADSGSIREAPRERWTNIDAALRVGLRGLPPGSSLARLLDRHRGVRNRKGLPPYTEAKILAWADAHHGRTGMWPNSRSGAVLEAPGETWTAVEMALAHGQRGLPGGSSLPQLLARYRQIRNKRALPLLEEAQILTWADAHQQRTGGWPTSDSGPITAAPGETWCAVSQALKKGTRGLPGGSSLARLLEEHRGVLNRLNRPALSVEQILAWADAHHARTGRWPTHHAGFIPEAPAEKWSAVDTCLIQGNRSLPGGDSLARLLAEQRGARRQGKPTRALSIPQILAWADAHHERTGRWPTGDSGPIQDAPGEVWNGVDLALARGRRGLPGGSSLAKLLAEQRGRPTKRNRPLAEPQILAWADAHHARTGRWPTAASGEIPESAGDTWHAVDKALRNGTRSLPGDSSLPRLLSAARGVMNIQGRRPLAVAEILTWADAYHARTGQWPRKESGPIPEAPGETWATINNSLIQGHRGLPDGSSLPRLLDEHRGVPNRKNRPPLTLEQILAWADAHYARHGRWPRIHGDRVEAAPEETWSGVESALQQGSRGLPGGTTLYRLLGEHRGVSDWRSRRR